MSTATVDRIRREAQRCWPREACGLLIGSGGVPARVHRALPAENRAARQDRYLIEAVDVMNAVLTARREGLELLGAYHSHPGSDASPSRTDAAETWGDWLYLIVSCEKGEPGDVRCWRWTGEEFAVVRIEIRDEPNDPAARDPR